MHHPFISKDAAARCSVLLKLYVENGVRYKGVRSFEEQAKFFSVVIASHRRVLSKFFVSPGGGGGGGGGGGTGNEGNDNNGGDESGGDGGDDRGDGGDNLNRGDGSGGGGGGDERPCGFAERIRPPDRPRPQVGKKKNLFQLAYRTCSLTMS